MAEKNYVTVFIRLVGIFMVVSVVVSVPDYIVDYLSSNNFKIFDLLRVIAIGNFIPFLVGLLLWFFPSMLSGNLVKEEIPFIEASLLNGLEIIFIKLIGVFFFFHSISDIVFHISNFYMLKGSIPDMPVSGYNLALVTATIAELCLSILLITKPQIIARHN